MANHFPIRRSTTRAKKRLQRANDFADWLATHGYNYATFGRACGVNPVRVRSWALGERMPPILLDVVLELLERKV